MFAWDRGAARALLFFSQDSSYVAIYSKLLVLRGNLEFAAAAAAAHLSWRVSIVGDQRSREKILRGNFDWEPNRSRPRGIYGNFCRLMSTRFAAENFHEMKNNGENYSSLLDRFKNLNGFF